MKRWWRLPNPKVIIKIGNITCRDFESFIQCFKTNQFHVSFIALKIRISFWNCGSRLYFKVLNTAIGGSGKERSDVLETEFDIPFSPHDSFVFLWSKARLRACEPEVFVEQINMTDLFCNGYVKAHLSNQSDLYLQQIHFTRLYLRGKKNG